MLKLKPRKIIIGMSKERAEEEIGDLYILSDFGDMRPIGIVYDDVNYGMLVVDTVANIEKQNGSEQESKK